jgi:glutamate/tyrosine decarboxylase-like PLP-dependent enzyme
MSGGNRRKDGVMAHKGNLLNPKEYSRARVVASPCAHMLRQVAEAGAIGSLGKLVNSRSSSQRAAAARALTNLAMHAENRAQMEAGGMVLPGLIKMVTPLPRSAAESAQKDVSPLPRLLTSSMVKLYDINECPTT